MGAAAVKHLAMDGWRVIMACRNLGKGEAVRQRILEEIAGRDAVPAGSNTARSEEEIELRQLDLQSIESVREFAAGLEGERIDALFNNAGTISRRFALTRDGFESTLQTNYIGPFLLTRLLAEKMPPGGAIVNMVSLTTRFGNVGKDLFERSEKSFSQLGTYSDTKLALLLFSIELAKRYPSLRVNVADPGIVNSNMISMGRWFDPLADILFRPFCRKPEKGVTPALNALVYGPCSRPGLQAEATERCGADVPQSDAPGRCDADGRVELFSNSGHRPISKRYLNHPLSGWLWDKTETLLK